MHQDFDLASKPEPHVLVGVEDDSLRSSLEYILRTIGFSVLAARDGTALRDQLRNQVPDVLLFEARLPGIEAKSLCSHLRIEKRTRDIITIILASADESDDDLEWLKAGADDCVAKPFSPEKLLGRIHAALLHAGRTGALAAATALSFADLKMDTVAYCVQRNGSTIHLAPTEFRLLHHLMRNPHRVYSRNELQNAAWPRDAHIGARTVDVHMGRLRYALKKAGAPDLIHTVRSVGYSLSDAGGAEPGYAAQIASPSLRGAAK